MDYKKKYLKYKKKYLESKNLIKNKIIKELQHNPNIKNKLKGGMGGDTIAYIVSAVLGALGVGAAGYYGYDHFKKITEPVINDTMNTAEVGETLPAAQSVEPAAEAVEPELTRTFTALEETPTGVLATSDSRAAQKAEDKLKKTPGEFDEDRGFEDAREIVNGEEPERLLNQMAEEEKENKKFNEKLSNQRSGYF